jgi:hypothetical protein
MASASVKIKNVSVKNRKCLRQDIKCLR